MLDVVSIGSATLDVFLRSPGMEIETDETEKEICVRYGAKLEVNEIFFESGGGGTNTAVTFARQGLSAASVVQVGDDFSGKKILEDLKKEGINIEFANVQKGMYTDYSTILWAPDGGRTILIYRGKTKLGVGDIAWDRLATKWFYLSSTEGELEIVKKVASFSSVKIAWNPGSRELKQKEELLAILPKISVFNVNKEEMEGLVNQGKTAETPQLLLLAQKLPCRWVVITDDKRGAYLWSKEEGSWVHAGIFEDTPRVETTGAGDAFGSGLVTGLIKGESMENCLYLASANASSNVSVEGAKKGLLKTEDLENWPKEKLAIRRL